MCQDIKDIATYAKTREIIEKYGFHVKKNFGQNFLIDPHVVNKIIAGANICDTDLVIEIGPGIGGLTQRLSQAAQKVIAIEIDKTLIPVLAETLASCPNVEIINADILKVELEQVIKEAGFSKAKIVANLPYYITTPIIMGVLENHIPIESMTVMVQKEVGERMRGKPSTKDFGSLSLAVQYYANTYLVANVPQNCFIPRPNIDSAVIRLDVLLKPAIDVEDEKTMFEIIKAAFGQRRKTLVNCLFNLGGFALTKEEIGAVLQSVGIDVAIRGENLGLEAYAALTNAITEYIKNKPE